MKSIVINKIVYIADDKEICFCNKDFHKTCISRIANDLNCSEMLVRLTPIEREIDSHVTGCEADDFLDTVKSGREFFKTLDHLDRMK